MKSKQDTMIRNAAIFQRFKAVNSQNKTGTRDNPTHHVDVPKSCDLAPRNIPGNDAREARFDILYVPYNILNVSIAHTVFCWTLVLSFNLE